MLVHGIICKDKFAFSRHHHDCIHAGEDAYVDGGQFGHYWRIGGEGKRTWAIVPGTYADYLNDYNRGENKYGIYNVKDIEIVEAPTLVQMEERELEKYVWGTYGKDGTQPLTYKKIVDLETDHLQAILDTQKHLQDDTRNFILDVLAKRR